MKKAGKEQVVKSVCYCLMRCGMDVYLKDGRIVKVEGTKENPISQGYLCPKGEAIPEYVYSPDRLKHPVKKVGGSWKRISWDEAIDTIANKLLSVKKGYGAKSTVVFIGNPIFLDGVPSHILLRRFLDVYGTPNYFSVDSMCYRTRTLAYFLTHGDSTRADMRNTRMLMVIGANVDNSATPVARIIRGSVQNGARLIVIDPKKIPLADEADIHLRPRPGTDCALLLAMMNVIISEGLYDREFVDKWTLGFDKLAEHVKTYSPEKVAEITWVPADQIRKAARLFATIKPACVYQGFNTLDQTTSGFQSSRSIAILAAITGNLGIKGGFIGKGLLKVNPTRLAEMLKDKPLFFDDYRISYEIWGQPIGEGQGLDLPDVINSEKPYPIKAMIIDGSNPALTWPDSNRFVEAFKKVEFKVVMDSFMTPTAELADIVLPAATQLERTDLCIDNRISPYMVLRKKVIEFEEAWSDSQFWLTLAHRMGYQKYFPWKVPEEFIDYWLAPSGYTVKYLTEEKPEGFALPEKVQLHTEKGFGTPSGKIELYSETMKKAGYDPLPTYVEPYESPISRPDLIKKFPLILGTGVRVSEFTSSQMRNIKSLRNKVPEAFAEMHSETANKYGIRDGETIAVSTQRGSVTVKAKIDDRNLPNVVTLLHGWRDANCNLLTFARPGDPITGLPNFKSMLCGVSRSNR